MAALLPRPRVPETAETRVRPIAAETAGAGPDAIAARLDRLISRNREIRERARVNLDPGATAVPPGRRRRWPRGRAPGRAPAQPGERTETGLAAAALKDGTPGTLAAEMARRRKTFCGLHSIRNG